VSTVPVDDTSPTVVDAFAQACRGTGAVVHRCAGRAEARSLLAGLLSGMATTPDQPTVAAAGSAALLLPAGVVTVTPEGHGPYLDVAVSPATAGIAETGSLLLAPATRWDRLMSALARVHVVAVAERDVRRSLDDVVGMLDATAAPYVSLVTGPTRTADIERVITIGAHGPAALHVLILAEPLDA
jgi:L-lactate dehydrogenase complex protein LldG